MKQLLLTTFLLLTSVFLFGQSYLGTTTRSLNLRTGPGTEYQIIRTLQGGESIFIISGETENEFYNVVDIATDKEGYVHRAYIKITDTIEANEGGIFTPQGRTTRYEPDLEIYNNTNKVLTLKLNSETYTFRSQERKTITLRPGNYDYRASAPGVIPDVGKEYIESNMSYSWQFYIVTQRR